MTRIERQTAEAVIALLDAFSMHPVAALQAHRIALRASLDADPALPVTDPYSPTRPGSLPETLFSRPTDPIPVQWPGRPIDWKGAWPDHPAVPRPQQYDAEEPTGA